MHPLKKTARIAGAIYLSMVITGPFSLLYVPGKLIVHGDAAATANNILAHETMFRFAIIADLFASRDFHLSRHRALSVAERRKQDVGSVDGCIRFGLGRGRISRHAE